MRLAADASALVGEFLRVRGKRLIAHPDLNLYITWPTFSEVTYEIGRRLDERVRHGQIPPELRDPIYREAMDLLRRKLILVPEAEYGIHEAEARDRIPQDAKDWPTLALALHLGIGIWTVDRDFFGCGAPVWTTHTLLRHVATGRARRDA